jgi:hypothetical protein
LTKPAIIREDALTRRRAWEVFDALIADPRIRMLAEPQGLEPLWVAFSKRDDRSHLLWTDDYLAAFAQASDAELVTFDKRLESGIGPSGSRVFDGINMVMLLSRRLSSFQRLALATTVTTYFLILVGGLVRASGAGLGCPDWPKCFGRWIPPSSAADLPPQFDPSLFNPTLMWTEYLNRLLGVTVGFLILATVVSAWRHHRHEPRILWTTLAALLLTGFQGWLRWTSRRARTGSMDCHGASDRRSCDCSVAVIRNSARVEKDRRATFAVDCGSPRRDDASDRFGGAGSRCRRRCDRCRHRT